MANRRQQKKQYPTKSPPRGFIEAQRRLEERAQRHSPTSERLERAERRRERLYNKRIARREDHWAVVCERRSTKKTRDREAFEAGKMDLADKQLQATLRRNTALFLRSVGDFPTERRITKLVNCRRTIASFVVSSFFHRIILKKCSEDLAKLSSHELLKLPSFEEATKLVQDKAVLLQMARILRHLHTLNSRKVEGVSPTVVNPRIALTAFMISQFREGVLEPGADYVYESAAAFSKQWKKFSEALLPEAENESESLPRSSSRSSFLVSEADREGRRLFDRLNEFAETFNAWRSHDQGKLVDGMKKYFVELAVTQISVLKKGGWLNPEPLLSQFEEERKAIEVRLQQLGRHDVIDECVVQAKKRIAEKLRIAPDTLENVTISEFQGRITLKLNERWRSSQKESPEEQEEEEELKNEHLVHQILLFPEHYGDQESVHAPHKVGTKRGRVASDNEQQLKEVQETVEKTMRRALQDVLGADLASQPPVLERLVQNILQAKEELLELCPRPSEEGEGPASGQSQQIQEVFQNVRSHLEAHVDKELIQQMAVHNALDLSTGKDAFLAVAHALKTLGKPDDDRDVALLEERIRIAFSSEAGFRNDAPTILCDLLFRIRRLKMDIASYRMNKLVDVVKENAVAYERSKFAKLVTEGAIKVGREDGLLATFNQMTTAKAERPTTFAAACYLLQHHLQNYSQACAQAFSRGDQKDYMGLPIFRLDVPYIRRTAWHIVIASVLLTANRLLLEKGLPRMKINAADAEEALLSQLMLDDGVSPKNFVALVRGTVEAEDGFNEDDFEQLTPTLESVTSLHHPLRDLFVERIVAALMAEVTITESSHSHFMDSARQRGILSSAQEENLLEPIYKNADLLRRIAMATEQVHRNWLSSRIAA